MNAFHAGDALGDNHAFVHALVREPGWTDEIADGVEAARAGLAPFVHHHMRLVDFHAHQLEADVLDIAYDAHGQNGAFSGERFRLAVARL